MYEIYKYGDGPHKINAAGSGLETHAAYLFQLQPKQPTH
jgi:hypothetical protein